MHHANPRFRSWYMHSYMYTDKPASRQPIPLCLMADSKVMSIISTGIHDTTHSGQGAHHYALQKFDNRDLLYPIMCQCTNHILQGYIRCHGRVIPNYLDYCDKFSNTTIHNIRKASDIIGDIQEQNVLIIIKWL